MTDILKSYTDLSSSTPRHQVSVVLQSIINGDFEIRICRFEVVINPILEQFLDQSTRAALIRLLLKDLKSSKSRLLHKGARENLFGHCNA